MLKKNIFSEIRKPSAEEILEVIIKTDQCKIERIISSGHATENGYWFDQDKDEWVIVLRGSAILRFEGSDDDIIMEEGDYINIPAHHRHRVEWTDPEGETIWLAVHY